MTNMNYKWATFDAVSQLFTKMTLAQLQASRAYWRSQTNGERECKRRRQQIAYDAGLVARRAIPR